MAQNITGTKVDTEDVRDMLSAYVKLPESVQKKIAYMIEGASLVNEIQECGFQKQQEG